MLLETVSRFHAALLTLLSRLQKKLQLSSSTMGKLLDFPSADGALTDISVEVARAPVPTTPVAFASTIQSAQLKTVPID